MIQLDGQNLFALRYECKHASLYAAYDSIKRSLDHCLFSIFYINSHRNRQDEKYVDENITAHSTMLITHYGRCFASGRAKLEKRNVPKEHLETHDKIMNLRNKYIAHSGGNGEASVNLIALYPNSDDKRIVNISAPILARINYINESFLLDVQNIVHNLIKFVVEKLKTHYEHICSDIKSLEIDELYREFDQYNLKGIECSPKFSPGQYEFKVEIKNDGRVYLKGLRK